MNKSKYILFLIAPLILIFNSKAATCISMNSGSWSNSATWSCGSVPACGDSIIILTAHTVTIVSQQNYTGCSKMRITVYGTLQFTNGNKLLLPCDAAIYVMPGGSVRPGTGGGNSNLIEICGDTYWNAAAGTYTGPGCMPPSQPGCGAILPIELSAFTGTTCSSAKICLKWETNTERSNNYFDVQRSGDISEFRSIGKVFSKAPNGTSTGKLNYSYTDESPLDEVSYYRLMQVDKDNNFSFSKIISVDIIKSKNIRFIVYPNPNSGEFTADISGLENNHEVKIFLRDLSGSLLYESSFFTRDQNANIQITPSSKLKSGVYVCSLVLEEIEYKVKVVVNAAG